MKKLLIRSFSAIVIILVIWTFFLLNPGLSYAHHTQVDNVTIYHNESLQEGTELIVMEALSIIKNADIYNKDINIQLCLNDDKIYSNLHPLASGIAYAFLNKTVIYASEPNFDENVSVFSWSINHNEVRKYNLTELLAHEFMHNLQHDFDSKYYNKTTFRKLNWKLEGHAEYIARGFKFDGQLKDKIDFYLKESFKSHIGIPVIKLEDGTIQNLAYFKYGLVIQYLIEERKMNFNEICTLDTSLELLYSEMIEWKQEQKYE